MDNIPEKYQLMLNKVPRLLNEVFQGNASHSEQGSNGFEDLRRHIKQGNEFCQQMGNIIHERSEAEIAYAKALLKLGLKINKVTGTCLGTLSDAWSLAGSEMEAEGDRHKQLGQSLLDDLAKPLKTLAEQQNKSRKPIESRVDKAHKCLMDRRTEEIKYKKNSFSSAKEREKMCDLLQAARAGRGKNTTEKDISKMEKKIRSLEDSLRKLDKEYLELSQKAESARQDWELCIYKSSADLQKIEEERIAQMQDLLNKYNSHLSVMGPKMITSCDRLGEAVLTIDVTSDIRKTVDAKGTGPNQPEQILPDFYAEDMLNAMDRERRRQSLQNYLIYIQQDIERELKGKDGVEKLLEVYRKKPSFADDEAQEESRLKSNQVDVMISFLEASHYKISCAMADLDVRPKPSSKFQQFIERTKDKQGQATSILRMPSSIVGNGYSPQTSGATYRAPADGGHVDSYAEKPVQNVYGAGSFKRQHSKASAPPPPCNMDVRDSMASSSDDEFDYQPLCRCKVIYDYVSQQHDELTVRPGDILTVYEKQVDGWWQGEKDGQLGIFPATYVEELPL